MQNKISLENLAKIDGNLPTLPGVALELLDIIKSDNPDIDKAAEIISSDPPLAVKMLQTINSPFYGLRNEIVSVSHAISLLGLNALKNLAMSFSLISNFKPKKDVSFSYAQFWKDSLVGAVAASEIAGKVDSDSPEEAFFAGLLQNIGSLILAESYPEKYEEVVDHMKTENANWLQAESAILGIDHTVVGEFAVRKWGLPEVLKTPIGCHHYPMLLKNPATKEQTLTQILHLSSMYIDLFNSTNAQDELFMIAKCLDSYDYSSRIEIAAITHKISEKTRVIFPLFDIEIDENEHISIVESAKTELTKLSNDLIVQVELQKKDVEKLKGQVAVDGLTKLYNKVNFMDTLKREIKRSARRDSPLSIIMADIDHFKSINDFYGHLAGDHLLKAIAEQLKAALRESDFIARYGGEEFVVLLPDTSESGALQTAEKLREAIQSLELNYRGKKISATMSFGVAALDHRRQPGVESLIQMADEALYKAKDLGRNRICIYKHAKWDESLPAVLVVDDEEVVLITVSKMLERMGYGVICAENGREALDLFDRHKDKIDTVFLDVMMPGLSAVDVLKLIKEKKHKVRVYISSGYSNEQIDEELIDNCDGFLAKPYTLTELSEKLQSNIIKPQAVNEN